MRLTNSAGGGNSGGGSGGPTTLADGADVAQGSKTDAAGSPTLIGQAKATVASLVALLGRFPAGLTAAGNLPVAIKEGGSGAKYSANLPNYSDGQSTEAQADSRGRGIVTMGTLLSGERPNTDHLAVNEYYPTFPIAAGGTGQVFQGAGGLGNVLFTAAGSVKIYDINNGAGANASQLAAANKLPNDGSLSVAAGQMVSFKWAFSLGCYIVCTTTGAVAAGSSGVRPN